MDITFGDSDIVEKNENILIHLFFNILDFDFRNGFFSNESSIHDMGTCGFTEQDYQLLAQNYYETCPEHYTYSEGQKFYLHLSHDRFDNMVMERFEKTYGFSINKNTHLLTDIITLLKDKFPNRDWDTDNIFIVKTLDNRLEKEENSIKEQTHTNDEKVVQLPVRKKLTPDEIKSGYNQHLMVKELGMTWEDATQLAKTNLDKQREGKKFMPYVPNTKKTKNKP